MPNPKTLCEMELDERRVNESTLRSQGQGTKVMIRNAHAQLDLNTNISPICIMYIFAFAFSRTFKPLFSLSSRVPDIFEHHTDWR